MASQAVFFGLFLYLFFGAHYTGRGLHRLDRPALLPLRPAPGPGHASSRRGLVYAVLRLRPHHGRRRPSSSAASSAAGSAPSAPSTSSPRSSSRRRSSSSRRARTRRAWPRNTTSSIFVLVGAVFGLDLAGYLDPLSFLTRSFALAVLPALAHALSGLIGALYGLGLDRPGPDDLPGPRELDHQRDVRPGLLDRPALPRRDRPQRPEGALLVPLPLPDRAPCSGFLSRWNLLQAQDRRREMHQVRPLHPALRDPGQPLSRTTSGRAASASTARTAPRSARRRPSASGSPPGPRS